MVLVRVPGRKPRPFPYMPWPEFTTDGTKYIMPPSPDSAPKKEPFPTGDPLPTDTCAVCLGTHNRNHCPFVLAEGNLAWGQAELGRLQGALEARKAGKKFDPPKTSHEVDCATGAVKGEQWPFIDWHAHMCDTPTGTIKEQEDHLKAHSAKLDCLSSRRRSMHEDLCKGRCTRYNHSDGECSHISFREFEKAHARDLEKIEARQRKLQGNKEKRMKALDWKPTKGTITPREIRYRHRHGWTMAELKKEKHYSDDPQVLSPCAGREKTWRSGAGQSALRRKGSARRGM